MHPFRAAPFANPFAKPRPILTIWKGLQSAVCAAPMRSILQRPAHLHAEEVLPSCVGDDQGHVCMLRIALVPRSTQASARRTKPPLRKGRLLTRAWGAPCAASPSSSIVIALLHIAATNYQILWFSVLLISSEEHSPGQMLVPLSRSEPGEINGHSLWRLWLCSQMQVDRDQQSGRHYYYYFDTYSFLDV